MLRFQESLPAPPSTNTRGDNRSLSQDVCDRCCPQASWRQAPRPYQEFIAPNGPGRKLQEKLLARRENPKIHNWLSEWWNDTAYLSYRDPVVPYVSYFYSHRDDRRRRDPAKRAAAISTAVLEFKKQVDSGTLEPEYMKKLPICMDSYKWMFNASRVAAKPADYPVKFDLAEPAQAHPRHPQEPVLQGRPRGCRQAAHHSRARAGQFRRVYELANSQRAPAVGALTSENRDVWTDAPLFFSARIPATLKPLEAIESASFTVCLDDAAPVTLEERAHAYWHGDGQNRWYDKPLQFIVNDNGTSGFMGEHSMMDGTPTHRLNDFVNDVIFNNKLDFSDPDVRSNLPEPQARPLRWSPRTCRPRLTAPSRTSTMSLASTSWLSSAYQGYGKGLIKKFRCSPDAYVQMIIQLAYKKMYGKNGPTYESAATRRFQQGRTETCRTVSEASVAWCAAMADADAWTTRPASNFSAKPSTVTSSTSAPLRTARASTVTSLASSACSSLARRSRPSTRTPASAYSSSVVPVDQRS